VFHLHKAVLEAQSVGPWEPTEDDIPVLLLQRGGDGKRKGKGAGEGGICGLWLYAARETLR